MTITLDELIDKVKTKEQDVKKTITTGVAAQESLKQVLAVIADLTREKTRRRDTIDREKKRFIGATEKADSVTDGLGPVDRMLSKLPGGLTLADLDSIVADDLPTPPDSDPKRKKYQYYVRALATADKALAKAVAEAAKARVAEAQARLNIDYQDKIALPAAVDLAVAAATAAKTNLDEALKARTSNDFARAYWAKARASALVDVVKAPETKNTFTDATNVFQTAVNAYAKATDDRLEAELRVPPKQIERDNAANQLSDAAGQVLKRLIDRVDEATKAGP